MNLADKAYWWLKNRVDFISRSLNARRTGLLDHRDDIFKHYPIYIEVI